MDLKQLTPSEQISCLRSLQHYDKRLETFQDTWPHQNKSEQNKIKMAEAGFFYTGVEDRVQCAFCLISLEAWEPGETPTQEHRRHTLDAEGKRYVFCPFLAGTHQTLGNPAGPDIVEIRMNAEPERSSPLPLRINNTQGIYQDYFIV
jgi:hypothetical protein